jgi:hypothetical protein
MANDEIASAVTGVADAVAVCIRLIGIWNSWTIVHRIVNAVAVIIRIAGVA